MSLGDDHELELSEEEDDSDNGFTSSEFKGVLSKWTNYIHGWQSRYIVLKDGTLSYYKSKEETGFGCRGAISLLKATIKAHEVDDCRFDVSVNDCVWYLRADSPEEKQLWVEKLETLKAESGYGSESSLKRHGSAVSLTSNTLSSASASSYKKSRGLKEKLAEMETYRDILCGQMDTLQKYFDSCVDTIDDDSAPYLKGKPVGIDFKGEAMTFKATSSAILTSLAQVIEAMTQREELWKRKLERERQRSLKIEQACETLRQKATRTGGPDQEEGPMSTLGEEEFYDAVETGLEKLEEEETLREQLQHLSFNETPSYGGNPRCHPLWPEIERITQEQVHYASIGVGEGAWQLFAEEGDMKMYRREEEVNGVVIDPLKACHIVKGVTGREMCHYFFSPQYRKDWESTLEQMTVVEKISDDTLVFLQVHKRIWPTAQRDALFWSHLTHMLDPKDHDASDIWAVVNHSTQLPQYPGKSSKCVRVSLTVCLYCQTLITPPKDGKQVTRENVTCKITYCSVVNPGGWVPASALRALYKREYPKFLKKFTSYVMSQTADKPIMF